MSWRLLIAVGGCLWLGLTPAATPPATSALPPSRAASRPAERATSRPADYPTSDYTVRLIEGWKVYVYKDLLGDQKALGDEALRLLGAKLYDINHTVPPAALARLHEVPIWIGIRDALGKHPCACYHPSRQWLRENGYNTDKTQAVEIANASTFLSWSRAQPMMVLHELSHSYHNRVLGFDNPEVRAAYQHAIDTKIYDSVMYLDGRMERAYAMNNDQEYFAELSEAYFGFNDFYPFVRGELKKHDPEGYEMIAKMWNRKK